MPKDLVELMEQPLGYRLIKGHQMIYRDEVDQESMPIVSTGKTIDFGKKIIEQMKIRINYSTYSEYQENKGD